MPKRKRFVSLLAATIPVVVALILIVYFVSNSERRKTEDLVHAYTERIAHGLEFFFVDAADVALDVASLPSVQALDWEEAAMDFAARIRAMPYIHRISLVDANGCIYDVYGTGSVGNQWQGGRRTENDSDPAAAPITVADREYFRALVEENTDGDFFVMLSEPFVPAGLDQKAIVTSAPIIKEGKAVGVVNVSQTAIELSHLYENIATDILDKFSDKAHVFLVSSGGQLVSNLEHSNVYDAYKDELFGAAEIIPVSTLGDNAVLGIDTAIREDRVVIEAMIHGERHFLAGVKVENTPFAVCLAVSKKEMLSASRWILLIGIIALAVAALTSFTAEAATRAASGERKH